jgi:ABC-type taurine transport system substrate-binding protein
MNQKATKIALGALLVSSLGMNAHAQSTKVRVSIPSDEITSFCMTTGMVRHPEFAQFRDKYKLEFEQIKMQISQVPTAISNQDIPIGECSGISTVVNAWNKGATNLVIFAVGSIAPVYQLIGAPSIKTLQDLKGKKIGTPGLQSASTEAIELILKRGANMTPGQDYDLVSAGAGSARIAALSNGAISAVPTYPPNTYELQQQGFSLLADQVKYVPQYVTGVHVVSREWAEKNREVLIRYIKSVVETGRWLENPANKSQVVQWWSKHLLVSGGKPLGDDYAARLYEFMVQERKLAFNGYAVESAVRANIDILKSRGFLKEEQVPPLGRVFDFSYLNQALKELNLPAVAEYSKVAR